MSKDRSLPILTLKVPEQRYSCRSCGRCCRHFTVQLRDEDIKRLDEQGWQDEFGEVPYHEFRGVPFLKQRADGACFFLQEDGRCLIHGKFGYTKKPIACQMFPFTLMPNSTEQAVQVGLSYACPSVIENHGVPLSEHRRDVGRMARALPELKRSNQTVKPIELVSGRAASHDELRLIEKGLDHWLSRVDIPMLQRLMGAVILTNAIADAVKHDFRDYDFEDMFESAFSQLEEELPHLEPEPPTAKQMKQLRQSVFAHVEDPKIAEMKEAGYRKKVTSQLRTNHIFSRGKGALPIEIGDDWPNPLYFEMVDGVGPATSDEERPAIDFLFMRYLRSRILGGRTYGSGYYGFPVVSGLKALWLMTAVTSWLARLHAGANGRDCVSFIDVEAALLRTDRTAGRAPWLGGKAERMREKFFSAENGYLRLCRAYAMTGP